MQHTVNVAVQVADQALKGYMRLEMNDGQIYQRNIDVPILVGHHHLADPPYVAAMLIEGVTELANFAIGTPIRHHGWCMPYRKDGLMVFEFDFETGSIVPPHGTNLGIMEA